MLLSRLIEEVELLATNQKRVWARNWIARKELREEDPAEYRAFMRMSREAFDALHNLLDVTKEGVGRIKKKREISLMLYVYQEDIS